MKLFVAVTLAVVCCVSAQDQGGYASGSGPEPGAGNQDRPTYVPVPVYPGDPVPDPTYAPDPTPAPYYPPAPTPAPYYPNPADQPADQNPPRPDLDQLGGLSCPEAGYMTPDASNLCFVWFCEFAGEAPIKRMCPKGVRVPSWWEGGRLNMCNIVNILKHGGEPTCLRCAADDIRPQDNCADNVEPCPAGCTCEDTEHTHRCNCPEQAAAIIIGEVPAPFDHCSPDPCQNGGTCQNQWDGYFCFCPNAYTGHSCETPICDWHPCMNGGTCVVDEIGYHCDCTDCWSGSCCNVTVPSCSIQPVATAGPAIVECPPCYTGPKCDQLIESCACYDPCQGSGGYGTCVEEGGFAMCQDCAKCTTGPDCKQQLDTCGCNNDCPANSVCHDHSDSNGHDCVCDKCYSDVAGVCTAQVTCECNSPCGTGQQCTMVGGQPTCGCTDSCYTGANCDQKIDTCACNNACPANSQCVDSGAGTTCACDTCYTSSVDGNGQQQCVPENTCACNNPCGAGQQCTMVGGQPSCGCENSCYTGPTCSDLIDTCECNPCPSAAYACSMLGGQKTCDCADKCYSGEGCATLIDSCECSPCPSEAFTCSMDKGSKTCDCADKCYYGEGCATLIDSCECSPCPSEAFTCSMDTGSKTCDCADKCYYGEGCATLIDSCECSPCPSEAFTCSMDTGSKTCACADSCTTGPGCTERINSCECNNPCNPSQTCSMVGGQPTCSCTDQCFVGQNCDVQLCACNNPCVNGGTCEDSTVGPVCACDSCHSGPYCQDEVQSCSCKTCGASEQCVMEGGYAVCQCPPCYTANPATGACDVPVDSCECNNPCNSVDTCQNLPQGGTVCECDCIGNEECVTDRDSGAKSCKCPLCFTNRPGEQGCLTAVSNLCDCNNPCTLDQQVCVNGPAGGQPICKIGNPSSGNAFTVVFEENDSEKSFREIPLELYMTPSVPNSGPRSVNIRSAGLAVDHHCYFNNNRTIEENSVLRFEVERCMMHNKTGLENLAIRLTELNNDTMIVYGINKDRWTADGFLATPDFQAGTNFQTVSYAPAHISTQFAIAALFDDTVVTIELADDNDLPAPYNRKGAVYTLTMNAFETFQVQARCPNQPKSKKRQCVKDLSGSIVTSSKKIHVFSGNVRAFVKAGEGLSRDHLVEEMIPTDRWGKQFGMVSVPGRAVGDVLNIMAKKGTPTNVDIYYNGDKQSISLPANGRLNTYVQIPSNKRIFINSDQPLSVTQLTKSKDTYLYQNETVHDPVTITIPPTEQMTNNFFVSTPLFTGGENFALKPYAHNYAMLVAVKGDEADIKMDGLPLSNFVLPWGDLPMPAGNRGQDLVGAVIEIPHGTRLMSNPTGANFQCLIYGFDDRESYGFPAAMNHARTGY